MIKYVYKPKFNNRLKEKRRNEKNELINHDDFKLIQRILAVLSAVLTGFVFYALYYIRNSEKGYLYQSIGMITILFILSLIYSRGPIFKILFISKRSMMELYYKEHNELIFDEKSTDIVIVPVTDNGKIIGILESLLYAFGVLIQNYTLIGVVMAIRSYVSVTAHNNKEESEFYIIGLMGSLLSTIVITGVYVLFIYLIHGVNIIKEISVYIP